MGEMKFLTFAQANISHLRSKYFTAKRFHLPKRANFIADLLYSRCALDAGISGEAAVDGKHHACDKACGLIGQEEEHAAQ